MSRVLDNALDAQRRAECEFNDRRIAAGEPCGMCGLPAALLETTEPEAHTLRKVQQLAPARSIMGQVRRYLLAVVTGVAIGQQVQATSCPVQAKPQPRHPLVRLT